MTIKTTLAAAVVALSLAGPGSAVTVNVDYEFGALSGTFYGLDNSDGVSAAASWDFIGSAGTYTGILPPFTSNQFTFSGGQLVSVNFVDGAQRTVDGGSSPSLYSFSVSGDATNGFTGSSFEFVLNAPIFTGGPAALSVSVVSLPASAFGLLLGVASLFGIGWRRKNRAVEVGA